MLITTGIFPGMNRRKRVLAEPDSAVAIKLKANPGGWYAIADGDHSQRHTLSQVAYRIKTGQQLSFRTKAGLFETKVVTKDESVVELLARYVPPTSDDQKEQISEPVPAVSE